jgi:hypothetical protein
MIEYAYSILSNRLRQAGLLVILAISINVSSCNKGGKDKEAPEEQASAKGFGESQERPEGSALVLPAGVAIENPHNLRGYSEFEPELCDDKDPETAKGIGDMVWICLPFRNTTNRTITVTIPRGWIVISKTLKADRTFKTQNGILVVPVTIEVPPLAVFYQSLRMICLNADRDFSTTGDYFEAGPVTSYKPMTDLLDLLNSKQINHSEHEGLIQAVVWKVTEGKELSTSEKSEIAAIPDK